MGRPLQIPWQDDEATLFHWYRAEQLPDLKPRLHALWLLRKGYGLRETAQVIGIHYVTLQQWVAWYRQGGVAAVRAHRKAGPGQPAWLSREQQAQFYDQVAQGRFHTGRDAQQWVEDTFGIRYQLGGTYSLLTRLKGQKKVPRPLATTASLEAQKEWKKGD